MGRLYYAGERIGVHSRLGWGGCCDGGCGVKFRIPYRTDYVQCFSRWLPALATVAIRIIAAGPAGVDGTFVPSSLGLTA